MSFVNNLKQLEPTKEETYDLIGNAVRSFMNGSPPQHTYTDYLRASGLHNLCPREFVLNYWNPQPNKSFDAKATMMVTLGTKFHSYMQNGVLGPMGVLYGIWKDVSNPTKSLAGLGYHPDPEKAIYESQHQLDYTWQLEEFTLTDDLYKITGHCDGLVSPSRLEWYSKNTKLVREDILKATKTVQMISPGDLMLCEMKSNSTHVFNNTNCTNDIASYYKTQTNFYMWKTKTLQTLFLYFRRDDFEMRGFSYNYNPGIIKDIKWKAQLIWESIRDKVLPDSMKACNLPTDPRAKKCVHSTECWNKRLKFKDWVNECISKQPNRKFLDLSTLEYPDL